MFILCKIYLEMKLDYYYYYIVLSKGDIKHIVKIYAHKRF